MGTGAAVAVAAVFVWLGMVLAISFLEAPLKFRAPGVTLAVGVGIGRVVFRVLNTCEVVLAVIVAAALLTSAPPAAALAAAGVAGAVLAAQLVLVRPALARRSDAVLAGSGGPESGGPRSRAHVGYVVLEGLKVVALLAAGILLLI